MPGSHSCWVSAGSELGACRGRGLTSSPFGSRVASILAHPHGAPPGGVSQCPHESAQREITGKTVCVIHELVDGNTMLLELSEGFHTKGLLTKTVREFWRKVLPLVPFSGNQSHGHTSGLCPTGPIKQVALQIIEKLKNVHFAKVTSGGHVPDHLVGASTVLHGDGGPAGPAGNVSLTSGGLVRWLSGDLENTSVPVCGVAQCHRHRW